MGLSFHGESSTVESSVWSLHFASDISYQIPENGIVGEEGKLDDSEIQSSGDLGIQMVDLGKQ